MARYANAEQTLIDTTIYHPQIGAVPTTISQAEYPGQWALTTAGSVEPFIPSSGVVPGEISFIQMLLGLVEMGWLPEAEAAAWFDGEIPAQVEQLFGLLPEDQQFGARIRAKRPSRVLRDDSLVQALAQLQNKSPADMDQFFTLAATL